MLKTKIIVGLAFLLLASGCIQETSIEERLLCIELSSYSATDIQVCDSQEKCLKEFEKNFSFDYANLNPFVQSSLSEFKNRTSLSWLYFNKSLSAIKKINAACYGNGFESIDTHLNEFNHSITKAFEQAEASHEIAFTVAHLEKADLEKEKIELIAEEELFNDYAAVNEALNSLSLKNSSSKDFAAQYFFHFNNFQKLAQSTGFSQTITRETSIVDAVDFFDEKLLPFISKDKIVFPIISSAYLKVFEFAKKSFEISRSTSALKSMPSFELFNAFNGFAGTKNSSTKKFVELVNSDNFHRKILDQKNALLEKEIDTVLLQTEEKISLIDDETYSSFDENFLASLAGLAEFSSTISSSNRSVKSLATLKLDSSSQLALLRSSLNDLASDSFIQKSSLGEKTAKLKELLADAYNLSESIDYYSNDAITGLQNVCMERVKTVKEKINGFSSNAVTGSDALLANLKFHIKQFDESTGVTDGLESNGKINGLVLCKQIIIEFNSLQDALENKVPAENPQSGLNECMQSLESFFKTSSSDFSDLKSLFESLKETQVASNPLWAKSQCESLYGKVLVEINSSESAQSFLQNHALTAKAIEALKKIALSDKDNPLASTLQRLSEKFSKQKEFIDPHSSLVTLKAFALLTELENSSFALLLDAQKELKKAVQVHLEKNVSLEIFSDTITVADSFNYSKIKVSAKNTVQAFDFPVSFSVKNFLHDNPKQLFATPNVSAFSFEEKTLTVDLNFVPLGSSVLVLEDASVAAKTTESTKSVSVSLSKAFFEKQITIDAQGSLQELIVSTTLPISTNFADTAVFFNGKSIPFEKEENKISFRLTDVSSKAKTSVFFSVKNPLKIDLQKAQSLALDQNSFTYVFFADVSNNLDAELLGVKIFVPLPLDEKNFELTKARTDSGEKISVEEFSANKILLSLGSFLPKEKKTVLLEVKTKNFTVFWANFLSNLKQKLSGLQLSSEKSTRENAAKLLEELLQAEQTQDFANQPVIARLFEIGIEAQKLFEQANAFEKNTAAFFSLKGQIQKDIAALEENAVLLRELGFEKDAQKILAKTKKVSAEIASLPDDPVLSLERLLSLKSTLLEVQETKARDVLLSETENVFLQANALTVKEKELQFVLGGKEKLFLEKENVLFFLNQNDYLSAKKSLESLKENAQAIQEKVLERSQKILQENKNEITDFEENLKEIPEKAEKLKGLQKDFLEKLGNRFFPTSAERIDKLLLKFDSFSLTGLEEKISLVQKLSADGNFVQAAVIALSVQKELSKNSLELKKIEAELAGDLESVKEEAFNAFYLAELKAKNRFHAQAQELLIQAKQKLELDDFVQAISLSTQAENLLDQQQNFSVQIPVVVYPIVLLGIAGLYFRSRQKNKPAPQKVKVERVRVE